MQEFFDVESKNFFTTAKNSGNPEQSTATAEAQ
jgi:hypothetical protein